jgi:hypothetical protein
MHTIEHFILRNREQKMVKTHFKQGTWWAWLSASFLVEKATYLTKGSIHRWLLELENTHGLIKSHVFPSNECPIADHDIKAYCLTPLFFEVVSGKRTRDVVKKRERDMSKTTISVDKKLLLPQFEIVPSQIETPILPSQNEIQPSQFETPLSQIETNIHNSIHKTNTKEERENTEKNDHSLSETEINNAFVSSPGTPSLDAQTEKEKSSAQKEKEFALNPHLRKIYENPAQMSADLFALWKSSEGHAEALKAVVEPLGIKTTGKKILFGRYLRDNICSKILTSPTYGGSMQSVIELHKLIVFKYLTFKEIKAEILELKEEPKKDADEYDRTRATAKKDKYADM